MDNNIYHDYIWVIYGRSIYGSVYMVVLYMGLYMGDICMCYRCVLYIVCVIVCVLCCVYMIYWDTLSPTFILLLFPTTAS